jgi:hypothetical protein
MVRCGGRSTSMAANFAMMISADMAIEATVAAKGTRVEAGR